MEHEVQLFIGWLIQANQSQLRELASCLKASSSQYFSNREVLRRRKIAMIQHRLNRR